MAIPTIFIAIANEYYQASRHLPELKAEASGLQTLLLEAENRQLCRFVIVHDATYQQVVQVFQQQQYRDTIAIFHFAGHAGSEALFLNTEKGESKATYRQGLVDFLSNQHGLQLVFLNACFTEQIAQSLLDVGVPAVVGTESAVLDTAASNLAIHFYHGLTRGLTIEAAWNDAKAILLSAEGKVDPTTFYQASAQRKDIQMLGFGYRAQRFPWSMMVGEGKSLVKSWSLPTASRQLLFGLPEIADRYDLHDEPFRYLTSYQEKDSRNFFGRSGYIQKIYRYCLGRNTAPLLLFYGQSGVGKSSLLQAGILPRLQQSAKVVLLKRDPTVGLFQSISAALSALFSSVKASKEDIERSDLHTIWRSIEAELEQPLVIIIDQAEELFTVPDLSSTQELAQVMDFLVQVFGNRTERPNGKLIFSYRKEFHPEFEDAIATTGIAYHSIFIKRLNAEEINEVVEGVAATPEHQAKYGIAVEANLGSIIAADLLKDLHSPVAPVLQILLSKMWTKVKADSNERQFSISLYHELQRQGIFLDDFYREQMDALSRWSTVENNEVVASGLALDVLYFHTTEFGTAKYRQYNELATHYNHQQAILPALVNKLKDLYLLASTSEEHTTLAHDTLAPIIQRAIKESNLPGQRASRLLEAKKTDYQAQPEWVTIEADDLAIVEEGQQGMRTWTTAEQALVERSRQKRQRQLRLQQRTRQLLAALGVLAVMFSIVSVFVSWKNSNKAKGNELISKALRLENIDPVHSLSFTWAAADYIENDPVIQSLKHDIYSYQAFYDTTVRFEASVSGITLGSSETVAYLAVGEEVQKWDLSQLSSQKSIPHNAPVIQVAYDISSESMVSCTEEHLFIWDKQDRLLERIVLEDGIYRFALSRDGEKILIADQVGGLWLVANQQLQAIVEPGESLFKSVAFSNSGDTLYVGDEDGFLRLLDIEGNELDRWQAQDNWILSIQLSPDGREIFTSDRDGLVKHWTTDGLLLATAYGHTKRVNDIQLLGADGWLTASDDKQLRWWDASGRIRQIFRGHSDFVYEVLAAPNLERFYSVGADSTLRVWRFHSTTDHILSLPGGDDISCLVQVAETGMLIAGTAPSFSTTVEDDFFDFDDAIEFGAYEEEEQPLVYWENETGSGKQTTLNHYGAVRSLATTKDGYRWVSGGEDGLINYYNSVDESTLQYESISPINCVALTYDGQKVGFVNGDGTLVIWQPSSNDTLELKHPDGVSALVFSPDGSTVYTAAYDALIRAFDSETGQLLDTFAGHSNWISSLAVSPDGLELLSGDWNNEIIRWSVTGGQIDRYVVDAKDLTGGKAIFHLTYSDDGQYFAFTTEAGLTQLMDKNGNPIQSYMNYDHRPDNGVLFSVDGKYLIRAHADKIYYWKLLEK